MNRRYKRLKVTRTRWLFVWENFLLPLNLFTGLIELLFVFGIGSLLTVLLILATAIGIRMRRLWGWYLNVVLIVVATLGYPQYVIGAQGLRATWQVVIRHLTMATLVIFVPNIIYFLRRKYLFEGKSPSRKQDQEPEYVVRAPKDAPWTCPLCGETNGDYRDTCHYCGDYVVRIVREDEPTETRRPSTDV